MGRLSPSAVAILRLLFLFCVVVAVGHAKVEELWRVPLGLSLSPVSADPLVTVTSDTYFAANDRGTIFAFSADGRQLWSAPGNDTLAALMSAPGAGDVLLAGYATDSLQPAVIQALDGKTGAPLWNRTLSFLHSSGSIYLIDSYRKAFVFAVPGTEGYTITSYDLRTGAIRWTQIVAASFIGNFFVTESVILVGGFLTTGLGAVTLSPASGDVICNFSAPDFSIFSLGGNVVFSHPTLQTYLLYDATTCAVLVNFTNPELLLEPFGTPTHMLLFASAAPSSECDLLVYSANGALQWNITLPLIIATPGAFYASVPVAGFDGDVLYVSWAGILSAYNATTGATLWSTAPTAVPVAPNPSPAIPLDHGRVFVPNLQGYVLFDANVQRVLEVNVQQPLSAPLVSHRADGSAVVVVGELGSGDLVALTERWDPVQTVWEVPLAIGPVPAASAVVAAQDALNYYVADPRGVIFALDAASGRVLWSSPGAGGLTGLQTLAAFPDRVFALMPGAVLALSATDGTVLWNVSASLGPNSFFAGMLLTEPALLMLTVDVALPVLTGYSPLTGAQLWTMSLDGWQGAFPVVASNEIGFIQTLIEDQPTFLQSFNLTTGAMHCATNVCGDVAGVYGELAVLRYGVPYCGDTVFSGASCATAKNLTTAFGGNFVFGASSLGLFVLHQTEDGQTLLSRVGMWSTAVPVPMPPPSTLHVARSPSDPSALVFGVAGYFGEVDAESGTLRWSGTAREPFMTSAVSPLPVFPLDRSTVFVASGSGYAVYDPSSQMTTAVVNDSPLAAMGFFVAPSATTAPLVVFVDLSSGSVKAVASNL